MHSCETLPGILWGSETPPRMRGQHEEVASHDTRWGAKVLTCRAARAAERRGLQGEGCFERGDKRKEPADHLDGNEELRFGCAGKWQSTAAWGSVNHSSGGCNSKISSRQGWFLCSPVSLACRCLPTGSSLHVVPPLVSLCVLISSSYKDAGCIGLVPTAMTSP